MKAKTTATVILFTFLLFTTTWFVFAQETNTVMEDGTADTEEVVPCETLQADFDEKVESFLLSEPTHTFKYQLLWLKTSAIIRKADLMGYETEDLEENLTELDTLTTQFTNNFDRFMQQMITTRRYLCSSNEQLYANAMKTTKDRLEDVRETARDINYLYEEEIRENILAIAKEEVMVNEEVTENE